MISRFFGGLWKRIKKVVSFLWKWFKRIVIFLFVVFVFGRGILEIDVANALRYGIRLSNDPNVISAQVYAVTRDPASRTGAILATIGHEATRWGQIHVEWVYHTYVEPALYGFRNQMIETANQAAAPVLAQMGYEFITPGPEVPVIVPTTVPSIFVQYPVSTFSGCTITVRYEGGIRIRTQPDTDAPLAQEQPEPNGSVLPAYGITNEVYDGYHWWSINQLGTQWVANIVDPAGKQPDALELNCG